jgi:hypothetical protein
MVTPKRKTFVAEFSAIIPWIVLLTVFAVMAALGAQQLLRGVNLSRGDAE